jgi:hypothetical protein
VLRLHRPLILSLLAVLAAGCGGERGSNITVQTLPSLVLQQSDLPDVFSRFDLGKIAQADTPSGLRSDSTRFGREDGWKARYKRSGSASTRGPLVVESRVDLFSGPDGAKRDLNAYRGQFDATIADFAPSAGLVEVPKLGDEAVAMTLLQVGTPRVRYFTIAWRDGDVTASVSVNGFDRRLTRAQALDLARRQQQRITAVSG